MTITQQELNEIFSFLIGLPLKQAMLMIGHDMSIRIMIKDGKEMPGDNFYKDNRLNVEMRQDCIYKIISIG